MKLTLSAQTALSVSFAQAFKKCLKILIGLGKIRGIMYYVNPNRTGRAMADKRMPSMNMPCQGVALYFVLVARSAFLTIGGHNVY